MDDTPVTYVIFDLLFLEGRSTLELPYEERRTLLDRLELSGESWQAPAYHQGDGAALQALTRERGLEGVVAKRLGSTYAPGKRTRTWLKIKNTTEQELVIGGWMPGEGRRSGTLGALLVGYYEDADGKPALRYAGRVGTGFTEATLRDLMKKLKPLATDESPFEGRQPPKNANFVKPKLVAQVEFREWTRTRTLRAPSFKGLRDDKDPLDVGFEAPEPPP
jgi:bifunctional non-homologous end joining protein LigD